MTLYIMWCAMSLLKIQLKTENHKTRAKQASVLIPFIKIKCEGSHLFLLVNFIRHATFRGH